MSIEHLTQCQTQSEVLNLAERFHVGAGNGAAWRGWRGRAGLQCSHSHKFHGCKSRQPQEGLMCDFGSAQRKRVQLKLCPVLHSALSPAPRGRGIARLCPVGKGGAEDTEDLTSASGSPKPLQVVPEQWSRWVGDLGYKPGCCCVGEGTLGREVNSK